MSHHLSDINYLSLEADLNHESEVVPADVKHSAFASSIGMRVNRLHIGYIQPLGLAGDLVRQGR
jgi:hypothetical protein